MLQTPSETVNIIAGLKRRAMLERNVLSLTMTMDTGLYHNILWWFILR